jgi:hypothetical protein
VECRIASYKAALLLRIPDLGCPTFIRDVPGVLCKHRENLHFAGGLRQAKPRANEENGLVVYWTLASGLLISIRIPLVIKKAATPQAKTPALALCGTGAMRISMRRYSLSSRCEGSLEAAEGEAGPGLYEATALFVFSNEILIEIKSARALVART